MEIDTGLSHLLRRRLRAQADLFAALTSHPTLIGTGREDALAELLRQFMPRRFEILQGTVAVVDEAQRPTRSTHQLDIIVADTMEFPTLLRSGNVAVTIAQSVRAVMEVKSNLQRGASFLSALVQIGRARQLLKSTDPVFTGLFSFGAPTHSETLRDWLGDLVALRRLLATGHGAPAIAKLRDALLTAKDSDTAVADEEDLMAVLSNRNLPEVIAGDQGAVARLSVRGPSSMYTFLGGGPNVPSVMILMDHLIEQLGATATANVNGAFDIVRAHLAIEASTSDLDALQLMDPTPTPSMAR